MRKVWKPTGKVFSKTGYTWKPTRRTFIIVENRCPLTRITSIKVVPPKETTIAPVVTPTSRILVYSRKPKATRSVGSSRKVKNVESKTSNSKEPKQSWRSTISDVPSSSLNDCRFRNDHIAKIMGYEDYQMRNITISQVHLNETVRNIRTDNGTEFVNQTLKAYYEEVKISHQTSVARTPQQNGVVERRNRTLVEAAQTMLIFSKALLFLWAKAYLNPPPCVDPQVSAVIAPEPAVSTGTTSSTIIDQDTPSTSTSQTPPETPSLVIPLGVEEA
ncbi:retrovirus-related pol polyprotein from transposon TNT 1-94 [Tanacetum coccineum]|uniref:Retrovirus-related pol polyprotein from transposon TNT 1-94 n=1 Tax=Tanacetum coccineum TaxID=301880 RepID=A0ABQ4Z5Z9_9ASTR